MCFAYTCRGCRTTQYLYCSVADWDKVDPNCDRSTVDPQPHIARKKCHSCKTIDGAIRKLNTLVFQQPWLETEGLGGADNRQEWERRGLCREEEEETFSERVWMQKADRELMRRLEKMGLEEMEGKEELNEGEGLFGDSNVDVDLDLDIAAVTKEFGFGSGSNEQTSTWGSTVGTLKTTGDELEAGEEDKMELDAHDDALSAVGGLFE